LIFGSMEKRSFIKSKFKRDEKTSTMSHRNPQMLSLRKEEQMLRHDEQMKRKRIKISTAKC